MALTTTISRKELERVAGLAYEGRTLEVMLCSVGTSGFTSESSVEDWETVEKSGNGYVRFTQVIPTGSYSESEGRYQIPSIDAVFTATSIGYMFDKVVIFIEGSTFIHSLVTESPNITLSDGQTQTYRINLICDD